MKVIEFLQNSTILNIFKGSGQKKYKNGQKIRWNGNVFLDLSIIIISLSPLRG